MEFLNQTARDGLFQYTGRNLGPCRENKCTCKAYCSPSPIGGMCAQCNRLCDKCQKPLMNERDGYRLLCLDIICNECESKYTKDEDIVCPRCNCMTPRKPFVIPKDENAVEDVVTLDDRFNAAIAKIGLLQKEPSNDV
ncbi:MAG: hypothetical protein EZS28_049055 [Streblomastix strix]|uniref:Uncharacterized protein n=1 Tax=Streblomastix strix TaxID=222440 RepID=A0A5J4TAY8_9EUKA|nr:MAG: hypothetical protein EZS28_049055 [Streblomastix strix]